MVRAYEHSCGGYYTAYEREDGSHWQPTHCVCRGVCYDSPEVALAVGLGELTGHRPDGGGAAYPDLRHMPSASVLLEDY